MDAVAFVGLTADAAVHQAACEPAPSSHSNNQVVFNGSCGTWLSGFFDGFEAFVFAEEIEDAADQFAVSCARCHGADLSGGLGGPTLLDPIAVGISDERKKTFISEGGTHGMPAFTLLSEEQIDALIAYIRKIQAG